MISLVPLHNPIDWFRFLINITGILTFNSNSYGGNPLKLSVCKNSVGYKRFNSSRFPDDERIVS